MAKSRLKSSPQFPYKSQVGRPESRDELLEQVEYLYPRIHGYLGSKKSRGVPLLPFEVAEIQLAVKALPRQTGEPPSRWAARIVAYMVSQRVPISGKGKTAVSYRYYGSISGGRVRNMLTELKARKVQPFARQTNSYEQVVGWIRNGEVELPNDVTE